MEKKEKTKGGERRKTERERESCLDRVRMKRKKKRKKKRRTEPRQEIEKSSKGREEKSRAEQNRRAMSAVWKVRWPSADAMS